MIAYPQVQEKVQQEIDSLVEQEGGLPELRHKTALPYTMAVTMEVMRLQAVAPLSVPHCAARDTSIQGKSDRGPYKPYFPGAETCC